MMFTQSHRRRTEERRRASALCSWIGGRGRT
uniref:Uncharacterized protein n=1 Tax=Anguilla anguilla TaxID=7936 RepID=A0A0E9UP01_ANGAN